MLNYTNELGINNIKFNKQIKAVCTQRRDVKKNRVTRRGPLGRRRSTLDCSAIEEEEVEEEEEEKEPEQGE